MKLNLLATTAVAALVASGGMWAQAQAPGPKQDDKTQMHEQKGSAQQNRDEKQAGKERSDQAKSAQRAQDGQQNNAAQGKMDAKKDDASKASERAQSNQPSAAAGKQRGEARPNERDRRNTASEMNKGKGQDAKSRAAKADKNQGEAAQGTKDQSKAGEQQSAGDRKDTQSKQRAEQSKPGNQPGTNAADSKAGNANKQPAQNQSTAQKNAPSANQPSGSTTNTASAKLSETDRSKVFSTLKSDRRASNQRIDIQVNVGTRLPARVHARPLPRTVVEVIPQYRGYEFVMVRDEIAIVRPGTREVVDVIHEPGSSASFAERSTSRSTIHLTEQQRTTLRNEARRFTSSQVSSTGNQCLSLQPVPSSLANQNPELKRYQMLAIGDDIVLIDPNQKKIVDVIQ